MVATEISEAVFFSENKNLRSMLDSAHMLKSGIEIKRFHKCSLALSLYIWTYKVFLGTDENPYSLD